MEQLLEKVLLEADMLDLKADPGRRASGVVIESSLEQGRGYVSTLLVEGGTLRKGDVILVGQYSGRVRNMFNERGAAVLEAGPSTPVSILGLDGAPNAGDHFYLDYLVASEPEPVLLVLLLVAACALAARRRALAN